MPDDKLPTMLTVEEVAWGGGYLAAGRLPDESS